MTTSRRRWFWLTLAIALAGLADFLLGNTIAALAFLPMLAGVAGSLLGGGGGLGGALGGGGGGTATATQGDVNFGSSSKSAAEQKKLLFYIGGGLAALALILVALWLFKRK